MNWAHRQRKRTLGTSRRSAGQVLALLENKPSIESNPAVIQTIPCPIVPQDVIARKVFKIMWAKPSTRKKRVWEGDGTLIVGKDGFTLKDEDGTILSSGRAPSSDLLVPGSILKLGSKEVEIMEISENDAQTQQKSETDDPRQNKRFKSMPMLRPPGKASNSTRDNLLSLPRPSDEHQLMFNLNKRPVNEVSVDAFLTSILRPHQREGLIFLYECVMGFKHNYYGAILADEMGLGKTLQCIALAWTLLKKGPYGAPTVQRVLVVTPSTLCATWEKEFLKWLGRERIKPFVIDDNTKVKDFNAQRQSSVMIISYNRIVKNIADIGDIDFGLMICDEAHYLKNSTNKAAQFLKTMKCPKRVLLTGTPVQNNLREYYVLVDIANPEILGNYPQFKRRYEDPILDSQKPDSSSTCRRYGEEKAAELSQITSIFMLRRTQDIFEKILPQKTEYVVCCKLTRTQRNIYNDLLAKLWVDYEAQNPMSLIIALKKICNHPSLIFTKDESGDENLQIINALRKFNNSELAGQLSSVKIVILMNLLKKILRNNEKIVIVSSSTQVLDLIDAECKANDITTSRLDGNTPMQQRRILVDKFNSRPVGGETSVFLLSARAGGVGLSLPGASRLILFDSDWNPAVDNQAMARIWRDGQRKPVHIYRLLATGTIEEKIYQRQIYKTGLSDVTLDSTNIISTLKLHNHELKDLFTASFDSESSTHDTIQCTCDGNGIKDSNADNMNRSINQLKEWEHFRYSNGSQLFQESYLDGMPDLISFVFRKTSQTIQ